MNGITIQKLPTIDESVFYQLLEEAGTVRIDVTQIERYFIPLVSYFERGTAELVAYGAIVRSHMDVLAAESLGDVLALLEDLAGQCSGMKINLVIEH